MHPSGRPLVISHRTNEGNAPENTLLGIERAIEDGADAVELDIRATADGALVLMHDDTLERTTGDPRAVASVTLEALRALRCGGPQGHPPQPIPTLEEALAALDGRIDVVIDIPAPDGRIEAQVAEAVRRAGAADWTWFTPSSEAEAVLMLRLCPDVPVVYDCTHEPRPFEEMAALMAAAVRLGARGINPVHTSLTPEVVARARELGLEVACWTVDAPADLARVVALGVDAITTNVPRLAFEAIEAAGHSV